MLKYKLDDLIGAAKSNDVNVIAHCCNVFNTMGSGIAPLIKKAFPEAYAVDCTTKKGDLLKLGTYTKAVNHDYDGGVVIYNLYGQGGFWGRNKGLRDLDYNALYNSLDAMAQDLSSWKSTILIGLPMIGAGLAGGSWTVIEAMIKDTLVDRGFDVTIYVIDKDKMPKEVNFG